MRMEMRKSRVLRRMREGKVAFSFKLNFACARAAEFAGMFGFHCIWSDLEHVANDWSVVESQVWAAKNYDTDIMVRVSKGSYSDYIRPLEIDAAGIMVPHVMSAEEAREIVRWTRFYPTGRRPVDGGNADAKYLGVGAADYIRQANEQRFVTIQIEDPEGIENLDEIAAVPGIDMLFFGPGDYSHSLGIIGQMNHPEVQKARKKVVEAAASNGKFAGTVGNPDNCGELAAMGYNFLNTGSDVGFLGKACREIAEKLGL